VRAELDMKDPEGDMTMHVQLKRLNQWRWRLWISKTLIRIAAWVAWMDADIEIEKGSNE